MIGLKVSFYLPVVLSGFIVEGMILMIPSPIDVTEDKTR